jgi:hypothetical protein
MIHLLRCLTSAARHLGIAARGAREFRSAFGMTYDDNSWSARSEAYDAGRELAHIATRRRYDASHG